MNQENKKRVIVVLGMHRSGTSAVTRGLKVLGVDLGNNLLGPLVNDNVKGFWEDFDLMTLNIEMLSVIGSDWHYLAPIQPNDIEVLRKKGYFLRAVELLRLKIGNVPIFGFKDPRVAKLLPFWKEVFSQCQLDVSYVLTIRHPLSVVKSLAKRNGFDPGKSYLLWLGHVIASLSMTVNEKCVIIDYDRLMQSPDYELNRIAKNLNLAIDPTELQSYKSEFLDQVLRHTVYDPSDLSSDEASPPLIREIYSELLEAASDKKKVDDLSLHKKINIWVSEFERLKTPLTLLDKLTKTILERDGRIATLNQALVEIASSRAWKLVTVLRKIRTCLTPKDSYREHLAKKVWRGIKNEKSHKN